MLFFFFFKNVIYVYLWTQKPEVLLCSSAPVTDAQSLNAGCYLHEAFNATLTSTSISSLLCGVFFLQQFSGSSPCLVCSGKLLQFTLYLWEAKIHCYARVKILSSGLYSGPEQSTHISSFIRDRCLWD